MNFGVMPLIDSSMKTECPYLRLCTTVLVKRIQGTKSYSAGPSHPKAISSAENFYKVKSTAYAKNSQPPNNNENL